MTGNGREGLAKAFKKIYPDVRLESRSEGQKLDLKLVGNQNFFAQESLGYDVFINNSYIHHFTQLELCRKVWTKWMENKKAGLIINIGSSAADLVRPDNRFYPTSKRALEDYSRQLYLYSNWANSKIRVSCINFGGIDTEETLKKWPHFSHLDVNYCAMVLDFVLKIPDNYNMDFLQLTPIQPKTKKDLIKSGHKIVNPSDYLISDFDD